ncbi:eCIS core domain-containing protein [Massilia frigida]|uniref:eCIS core domain-containing protein n=1 Tax=Massilia frigida TaxID=2609281 RepID=UPI001423DD30|nr:DUF4157 domain-containing protein [Massilia frigida]
MRAPGQALDPAARTVMERHFAYDFSQVRIHADARAAQSARAVDAAAYTVGRHLVFNAGAYAPHSRPGQELIAHELTHVIEQANGPVSGRPGAAGLTVSQAGDAHERQADGVASRLFNDPASGQPAARRSTGLTPLGPAVNRTIQRQHRSGASTRPVSRGPAVVEDGQHLAAGQMPRSAFLAALRAALLDASDAELRRFGRTARNCPFILRTIERYATRPLSSMMRLIQAFARPPAGADAHGLIAAVSERARIVARRIGQRQGPLAQAMTESRDATLPSHEPSVIRAQLGSGRTLDRSTRANMEGSFGTSFGSVRVHDDSPAARFNSVLGARAFTVGQDIAFAAGQYRPGTTTGDLLIAHELAHTVQQGSGRPQQSMGAAAQEELERQADRAAQSAVLGHDADAPAPRLDKSAMQVQRAPALVAAGLLIAEATPEAIILAEVVAVSTTEVVVADGALVVAAELAAPAILEVAAPVAIETLAPVAVEALAPAAVEASSSVLAAATATVGIGVAATTLPTDSPTRERRRRSCRSDPCPEPLPVLWPSELPLPPDFALIRTPSDVREAEGLGDRGPAQARFSAEIAYARTRHVPPPDPCDPMVLHDESRWNAPYDAHHIHPLYLGGFDVRANLCALETHLHQLGHPRLDNQSSFLDVYMECGICSASLKHHPAYQTYYIAGTRR